MNKTLSKYITLRFSVGIAFAMMSFLSTVASGAWKNALGEGRNRFTCPMLHSSDVVHTRVALIRTVGAHFLIKRDFL